jgi:hypothetical protein
VSLALTVCAETVVNAIDLSPNTGLHKLEIRGIRPSCGDPDWLTPVLARLAAPALHSLELGLAVPVLRADSTPLHHLTFSLHGIAWASVDAVLRARAPALEHLRVPVWRQLCGPRGENRPLSEDDYEAALKAKMPGMARILSVPDVCHS